MCAPDRFNLKYPITQQYDKEQGYVIGFSAAPYSVRASERTRSAIIGGGNTITNIIMPIPGELVVQTAHAYSEEANPVGPMLTAAGALNSGGDINLLRRVFVDPMLTYFSNISSTTSQQMYSNITELSLKSEARREYEFGWLLIPKNQCDAIYIQAIANAFREASYPVYADLPERIYPPPIWAMYISDEIEPNPDLTRNWLGDPMPLVLASVSVNKVPLDSKRVTYFTDGQPVATAISVLFKEFETGAIGPGGFVYSKSEYLSLPPQ
jgi:hypothetical protein